MLNSISIIMVTYNSGSRTYESLSRLIKSKFVKKIYVVDNSDKNYDLQSVIPNSYKIVIERNGKNIGIGGAQNKGIELAIRDEQKWVMTLDHDTIVEDKLLDKYLKYISENDTSDIAILGTDYIDINTGKNKFGNTNPITVKETISSGSLLNLIVIEQIGLMKENYIIDQVDNEYCLRAQKKGYRVVILPGADMEHKLGNITLKPLFGRTICLYNQSPIRTYYRTRNMIWLAREYNNKKIWNEKMIDIAKDCFRLLLEENKIQKYKNLMRGIYHGFFENYQ